MKEDRRALATNQWEKGIVGEDKIGQGEWDWKEARGETEDQIGGRGWKAETEGIEIRRVEEEDTGVRTD